MLGELCGFLMALGFNVDCLSLLLLLLLVSFFFSSSLLFLHHLLRFHVDGLEIAHTTFMFMIDPCHDSLLLKDTWGLFPKL